jgi:hypothetical protein
LACTTLRRPGLRPGKSPDLVDSLMLAYVEPKQGPEFDIDFF